MTSKSTSLHILAVALICASSAPLAAPAPTQPAKKSLLARAKDKAKSILGIKSKAAPSHPNSEAPVMQGNPMRKQSPESESPVVPMHTEVQPNPIRPELRAKAVKAFRKGLANGERESKFEESQQRNKQLTEQLTLQRAKLAKTEQTLADIKSNPTLEANMGKLFQLEPGAYQRHLEKSVLPSLRQDIQSTNQSIEASKQKSFENSYKFFLGSYEKRKIANPNDPLLPTLARRAGYYKAKANLPAATTGSIPTKIASKPAYDSDSSSASSVSISAP